MMCLKSGSGRYAVVAHCHRKHKSRIIGVNCFEHLAEAEEKKAALDRDTCGHDACFGNHPIIDQERYCRLNADGMVEYFSDEAARKILEGKE